MTSISDRGARKTKPVSLGTALGEIVCRFRDLEDDLAACQNRAEEAESARLSLLVRLEAVEGERDDYRQAAQVEASARRQFMRGRNEMLALLKHYRSETPLGNQPHMIAHLADEAIAKAEAHLQKDTSVSGPINTSHVGENHE